MTDGVRARLRAACVRGKVKVFSLKHLPRCMYRPPTTCMPCSSCFHQRGRGALDEWREGSRIDSPREAVREDMEWRAEVCLDANDACREATCRSHSRYILLR